MSVASVANVASEADRISELRPRGEIQSRALLVRAPSATHSAYKLPCRVKTRERFTGERRAKPIGAEMTNEQIKLLAQMLKNGQAKLVEQKDGKLVPVSLI